MSKKKDKERYPQRQNGENTAEMLQRLLANGLVPKVDPEQEKLEAARALCRKGNPFPLIAMQWPEMVLTDEKEIAIFDRHMRLDRFAHCSESIRNACFDPQNPPLRLDWWQKIILAGFFAIDVAEIYIKGCTGAGKGGSTSIGFCLWYDVYGQSRTVLTGRDKEHAIKNIFGETKDWFMRMQYPHAAEVLKESITESERHSIRLLNPDPSSPTAGEAFSGAHGANTIYGLDETSSLPDSFVENARKNARKIVCLSNPRVRSGEFYRAFEAMGPSLIDTIGCCTGKLGKRLCVTIGGPDCMNVAENRLKTPVSPAGGFEVNGTKYGDNEVLSADDSERVKPLIPRQMDVLQFRITQSDYLPECFAFGKFPKEDAQKQIIIASWLKRHEEAWNDQLPVTCIGADIALSLNGDTSVFAFGGISGCRKLHQVRIDDSIKVAEELVRLSREEYGLNLSDGGIPVCIDYGGGYGSGVGDYLKVLGVWVVEFQPGGTSNFPKNYANLRAEAYATLGLRFDPSGPFGDKPWAIPAVAGLREELCAPERVYANDYIRFRVHPKVEIKKALGRSPDLADALTYLFYVVRRRHELDQWLFSIRNRPLVCYPQNAEEALVRKVELEKEPPPRTEWDDIPFDWKPPVVPNGSNEQRKVVVAQPDKYQREPWWMRYTRDNER